jgi:hypothetical protein
MKRRYKKQDIGELLKDIRYENALSENTDEAYIDLLDTWFYSWFYHKDRCPCCGEVDFYR